MHLRRRKTDGASERALQDATEHMLEIKARGPEVNELVADMKRIRARNHFAEHLHDLMSKNGGMHLT